MAASSLNYQGINRAITDYGNSGACEELINLRPSGNGLIPVKPFNVKMDNVDYDKIYVHNTSEGKNYIALKKSGSTVYIYRITDAGAIISPYIDYFSVSGATNFDFEQVSFATAGNIVLFSVCDKDDEFYLNLSYLWVKAENKYKKKDYTIPTVEVSVVEEEFVRKYKIYTHDGNYLDPEFYISSFNEYTETDKSLCRGPFVIAIAYKTKDGLTFCTSQWFFYSPLPGIIASTDIQVEAFHKTSASSPEGTRFADFFTVYNDGYRCITRDSGSQVQAAQSDCQYVFSKVKLGIELTSALSQYSEISSIEIYASCPEWYLDMSPLYSVEPDMYRYWIDPVMQFMFVEKKYSEYDFSNKLLYLQKSIPIENVRSGQYTFDMEFGGKIQTTSKTLEVDAGDTKRYGKLLSYNARFHYYESVSSTHVYKPFIDYSTESAQVTTWSIFMIYDNDGVEETLYFGEETGRAFGARLIIAPSLKVLRVVLYDSGSAYKTSYTYNMIPSTRYNCSIYDGTTVPVRSNLRIQEYEDMIGGPQYNDVTADESSAINVTEQYNPAVFNVDNSYLAPGKVLDIQPQFVAVRDVSYGDYPLNVFTIRGVYALLQGNGSVLYAAFRPVSNLVSEKNSIPTESGTFFIAAGGLWVIAGNNAVLVSDALSRGPHKYIRSGSGYQALSMNGAQYDVSNLQSALTFEKYLEGATLSYNRYRDEIYVSNPAKAYTYVLSLKYRQWFKIDTKLAQDVVGGDIAIVPKSGVNKDVVDFSVEDSIPVLVHLQSRPFSFGYQYAHVHRIVAMIRAQLAGTSQKLIVALYGSDDLQEWKLIAYAYRKGPASGTLKFSQIRTPSAARSWRYFTVCMGGVVPTDADNDKEVDFGPVTVDYQSVIRRIG